MCWGRLDFGTLKTHLLHAVVEQRCTKQLLRPLAATHAPLCAQLLPQLRFQRGQDGSQHRAAARV